ncbi:hypothetical protein ACIS_00172 [Anaplasma centrale str. Israel]|uniref:Uncharacterized protein n=1 Tax=Anaplasma centrale (strain Israel) TaxID=574556 RepID=D1ATI1_ANACI|nr:hypothetical protein [Anaplasma centrale]ACZ48859.1 hypothetical protein ACIS_00172 [Anaplasma centrale str. Israel]
MLFDIEIEVGGEKLSVQNVAIEDGSGTFSTCACNGEQQKRVDGVWTPTYLVLSVGDEAAGACGSACSTDKEIDKGQLYIFEQWADEVMLGDRHAHFNTASGVMKFAFTGDGNDTVEFIDATGPTTVKFTEAKKAAEPEVKQPEVNTEVTTKAPETPPKGPEEERVEDRGTPGGALPDDRGGEGEVAQPAQIDGTGVTSDDGGAGGSENPSPSVHTHGQPTTDSVDDGEEGAE